MSSLVICRKLLDLLHEYVTKTDSSAGKVLYDHLIDNGLNGITEDLQALQILESSASGSNVAYSVQKLLSGVLPAGKSWSYNGKNYKNVYAIIMYPKGHWSKTALPS